MSEQNGKVHLTIHDGVAAILIDRPQARNAMTWAMYEELGAICTRIAADPSIRVTTIRGAGGEAFVAVTDIEQFSTFKGSATPTGSASSRARIGVRPPSARTRSVPPWRRNGPSRCSPPSTICAVTTRGPARAPR